MNSSTPLLQADPESTLVTQVAARLHACGHPSLRRLHVSAACDAVTLKGTLPSFYLKQMAQVLALSVDGVEHIVNDTVVNRVSA